MWYVVEQTFTYKSGLMGGRLVTIVYGKPAVKRQLENNKSWLTRKGHTGDEPVVTHAESKENAERMVKSK